MNWLRKEKLKMHMKLTPMIYIALLFLLTACGEDSTGVPDGPRTSRLMTFCMPGSRAAATDFVSGSDLPEGGQVGTFAFAQGDTLWDNWSPKTANLMYNTPMTVTPQNTLTYSPPRYWSPGVYYSFFAYYPFSATGSKAKGVDINTDSIGKGRGAGSLSFTVQPDAKDQEDLLLTDLITDQYWPDTVETPDPVTFQFHHLLSGLRFVVDLSQSGLGTTVASLDTVRLEQVCTRLTTALTSKNSTSTRRMTASVPGTVYATAVDTSQVSSWFLLPPQTVSDNAFVYARYTAADGSNGFLYTQLKTIGVPRLQEGTRRTIILQPSSSSVIKKNGDDYWIWEGSQPISSADSKLEIWKEKTLRNFLTTHILKVGSQIKVDYVFTSGSRNYDLGVAIGYDNGHSLYYQTNLPAQSAGTALSLTLTLDQDDIDYFKGTYYDWNVPLLTFYTKNSQDEVTIKQVTITP